MRHLKLFPYWSQLELFRNNNKMNWQSQYTGGRSRERVQDYSEIPPEGPPPRQLPPSQLLREQHYLKQFLYQLENSSNLPTLSDPGLLVQILNENQAMDAQLQTIRVGKREEMLQSKLLSLSREAQQMMRQMREFKTTRENEKAELKRLQKQRKE